MKTTIRKVQFIQIFIFLLAAAFSTTSCNRQDKTDSKEPKVDIHTAIITDNLEVLKQHIAFGKWIDKREPINASTPLITAIVFDKTEMATMIINADADLSLQNNDGSTALHTAAFFCSPEIVKLLLDKGANKTIMNKYGQTPYETVAGSFTEVEEIYKAIGAGLEPMGLKLDMEYIKKTRPQVATLLN